MGFFFLLPQIPLLCLFVPRSLTKLSQGHRFKGASLPFVPLEPSTKVHLARQIWPKTFLSRTLLVNSEEIKLWGPMQLFLKKKKETPREDQSCKHSSSMDAFHAAVKRTLTDVRTDGPPQVQPSLPAVGGAATPPGRHQHLSQSQLKPDVINGRQNLPSYTRPALRTFNSTLNSTTNSWGGGDSCLPNGYFPWTS